MVTTTTAEAKKLLTKALKIIPELTANGICTFGEKHPPLQDYLGCIAAAADWIKLQLPTKTVSDKLHSYSYKHAVEDWFRARGEQQYVSNGAFIAAALGLGFTYRQANDGPNAYFNFSQRVVKATQKQALYRNHGRG